MIIVLTIIVVLVALLAAWYFSGKILHSEKPEETVESELEEYVPTSWFTPQGPVPFDHERELHGPYGRRRL